ncbi:MAG: hypothetical protein O7H41_04935 [Planctomycetota bacterium]|nr:hypothetical protein [Planctomycetota bacterium]
MSESDQSLRDSLDRYIDGLLAGPERAAFERRLATDPDLAADLRTQRAIDSRLKETFSPPARVGGIARRVARQPASLGANAAAAVLIIGLRIAQGSWMGRPAPEPSEVEVAAPNITRVYAELAPTGPASLVGCQSEASLAPHFSEKYGQELFVRIDAELPIAGPFEVEGWPTLTVLKTRSGKTPILILIDARSADPQPAVEAGGHLRLYRRDIGLFVIHELSPLPEPKCLDLFSTK